MPSDVTRETSSLSLKATNRYLEERRACMCRTLAEPRHRVHRRRPRRGASVAGYSLRSGRERRADVRRIIRATRGESLRFRLRRDRELSLVDRQQLGQLHLGRIVQIKPRDIEDVLLEPKVELVLRLHEFGKRLLEVLALDVDHRSAATVDRGNPRNFLRDPESLLGAVVILLSRSVYLSVEGT